ncbi:hypothetical protein [Streptomyces sp. 049-1]|uniref:hypothetical protein n=1 Tax=Streptomyces sp. 049-1 TaxID=2789264 RepID=UPI00398188D6
MRNTFKRKGRGQHPAARSEHESAPPASVSPRTLVLWVLGLFTVGVAALSVMVSYSILEPWFGRWAVGLVVALDAAWVICQATEIIAANNRDRTARVRWAGWMLTGSIAAIPSIDLAARQNGTVDLATFLVPVAILVIKGLWWLVLPSLGRHVSAGTRERIAARRQEVADYLEALEADAADEVEHLAVAARIQERVSGAQTAYRLSVLRAQEEATAELHEQARATLGTITDRRLPSLVAGIAVPSLSDEAPGTLPALPGTPRHTFDTQVSALPSGTGGTVVTLDDLACVAGVPTPAPGVPLTDAQMGVVLRWLRYGEEPPRSYRSAIRDYRNRGYIGSAERLRKVWADQVDADDEGDDAEELADEGEESDRLRNR